jgi:uracil-DNA glycosylase family 4
VVSVPYELNKPSPGNVCVIGRDPGKVEVELGQPFVGPSGEKLASVLAEAGIRREDCNILNVVKERPRDDEFKNHNPQHVQEGLADLYATVARLKPSLIITLGNEAAYALLENQRNSHTGVVGWPTKGRGIYGAKDIDERRGYFWDTSWGTVLTTLHPSGVLHKPVPGEYLIRADFRRARKWLKGDLPRMPFPQERVLTPEAVHGLLKSRLIGWDIETKWDMTALLCQAFCGDDGIPYVAAHPRHTWMANQILESSVPKAGHNGSFDLAAYLKFFGIKVQGYLHDTQHMWWACEPELAGRDEEDEESFEGKKRSRMTRKALAFLMGLFANVYWWKDYPPNTDPDHLVKMLVLNGRDSYATRYLAGLLHERVLKEDVLYQYQSAMNLYPFMVKAQMRGLPVNEELRLERAAALHKRQIEAKDISAGAALKYIREKDLASFRKLKKCPCCGGGKVSALHCWRCGGLPAKPKNKKDYLAPKDSKYTGTVKELKERLPKCSNCEQGKIKEYSFNPYSRPQLIKLLVKELRAPITVFKNKQKMDQESLKRILKWSRGY